MNRKIISIVACLVALTLLLGIPADAITYKEYQSTLGRHNSLTTTGDPDRYAYLYIKDNILYVDGCFSDEYPEEVYFSGGLMSGYRNSFKSLGEGKFKAQLSGNLYDTNANVVIKFPSGTFIYYRIEYDDGGWFFGDNGIAEQSARAVESLRTASDEVTAQYISATLDKKEAEKTLADIKALAESITKGIDSDYGKAKAISRWISENCYYDKDASIGVISLDIVELGNVLETRRTICAGFTNLFCSLAESVGIRAINIKGGVANSDCSYEQLPTKTVVHEWAAFWHSEEGRWAYVDPAWDCGNVYLDGKYQKGILPMKYFDITGLAFSQDHRADSAEERFYNASMSYYDKEEPPIEIEQEDVDEAVTDSTQEVSAELDTSADKADTDKTATTEPPHSETSDIPSTSTLPVSVAPVSTTPENNTVFYIIIGVLATAILLMIFLLIRNKRSNKNDNH